MTDFDLAVVGSGFGGSLLAMIGRRLGMRVLLLEKGRHPRFAIGESASPLAGAILENLADRYDLPRIRPLAAYGPWCRAYPDVGCGLKRGFTYFKHEEGRRYRAAADRSNQLLVAASPCDEVSDTHWLRADVDHFLQREAAALGADYLDSTQLDTIEWDAGGSAVLRGTRTGSPVSVRARAVVDATGPRGFLSRALPVADRGFDRYPATQALFSHFTGVERCADMPDFAVPGVPPYPIDAAALHHVFDEGWMWVLRFDNGVTSAGIAVTDRLARELRIADGAPAWTRFLARYPSIAAQFAHAEPIREWTWMPRMAWRVEAACGPQWAMLPSAAAFVDPLFSTGIPLTLLGIERLASRLARGHAFDAPERPDQDASGEEDEAAGPVRTIYGETTLAEADQTARFIAGCYAAFPNFERFTAYSMFYFAAASYSEMARRLRRPAAAPQFLGSAHPAFAASLERLSPAHGQDAATAEEYASAVAAAAEPLNIAGLCNPAKQNWYGVDLEETAREAAKLGVTPDDVRALAGQFLGAG